MIREILKDMDDRMEKTIEAYRHDLMAFRTGRASSALVERLQVDYYNMPTPLMQLANISVPEAQTILIRPFAATDIPAIERAIAKSDLGLAPSNDGKAIRLNIPPLNEERRRDLSKQVARRAEEARVALRNIRRDAISDLREMEKESMITEDDLRWGQEQVQEQINKFTELVDQITKEKDDEIMTV
jgi:ribosome recycling factor